MAKKREEDKQQEGNSESLTLNLNLSKEDEENGMGPLDFSMFFSSLRAAIVMVTIGII